MGRMTPEEVGERLVALLTDDSPEALLHGILQLQQKIAAEQSGPGGVPRPDPLARDAASLTAPAVRRPS